MKRAVSYPTPLLSPFPESPKVHSGEPGGLPLFAINLPQAGPLVPAALVALCAGITDWRSRRIPNWLTVSGAAAGIATNAAVFRWPGLKAAFLGMGLGLVVLLPFVLVRSLGAGDWKMAGALGACLGPRPLLTVLFVGIFVAGLMALAVVIWSGRVKQTLLNMAHILASLFTLRLPGPHVSLDDPQATKVPFGVALAAATVLYVLGRVSGTIQT